MRKSRSVGPLLVVLGTLSGFVQAQDQIQWEFGTWAHLRPNDLVQELAQTFRPAVSGKLTAFRHFGTSPGGSPEYPTTFAITDVLDGKPGTSRLGISVVTNLTAQSYVSFDQAEIFLEAGKDYAVVISTEAPAGTSFMEYGFRASFGDAYSRGSLWKRTPFGEWVPAQVPIDPDTPMDLMFETYMEPGIPAIRIVSPQNQETIELGSPTEIAAAVSPTELDVEGVSFLAAQVVLGTDLDAPFQMTWMPQHLGETDLVAILHKLNGTSLTSAVRSVTVVPTRPQNDNFASRILFGGERFASPINQTNATVELGEPRPFQGSSGRTLWWQYTPARYARATVAVSPVPTTNAALALFSGLNLESLHLLTNGVGQLIFDTTPHTLYQICLDSFSGLLEDASFATTLNDVEIAAPVVGSTFQAPASFRLETLRTADERHLNSIELYANGLPLGFVEVETRLIDCTLNAPGYYTLQLRTTDADGITTYSQDVPIVVRPGNDDFENAQSIDGWLVEQEASNRAATLQGRRGYPWVTGPGEPAWESNNGGSSIWYQWTAPGDGLCVLSGFGEGFSLLFNVCQGTAITNLTIIASNAHGGLDAPVSFDATAGSTYYISVDGYFGEQGSLEWSLRLKPYNDNLVGSRLIPGLSSAFIDFLAGASLEPGEAALLPPEASNSVWYKWPAEVAGLVSINIDAESPVALRVFTGGAFSEMELIASGQETPGGPVSAAFNAQAGELYHIAVIGIGANEGSFLLDLGWRGLRVLNPLPNSIFSSPASLQLAAGLEVPGVTLQSVSFYANGVPLGMSSNSFFTLQWSGVQPGTYSITATGYTTEDSVFDSPPITCLVYSDGHYPEPRVFSAPFADTSYVINGVGSLFLFGRQPDQFGRTEMAQPSTPFLARLPDGVTGWRQVSASWSEAWGIDKSGKLYRNGDSLVPFPASVHYWKHVSGGYSGAVAVGSDGELYKDGTTLIEITRPPGGWKDARASLHDTTFQLILGLGEDGEAYKIQHYNYQWSAGIITRPHGVNRWRSIAQAAAFGLLQAENGELWINEFYGRLDGNPETPEFRLVPRPTGVNRWVAFAAGGFHALAIGDDRQLYSWGRNWEHQLGIAADLQPRLTPTKVDLPPGVSGWSYVSAGRFHSLAIADDCSLYGWGANGHGQLGQPESSPIARPTRISSLEALCGTPVIFTDGTASRLPDGSFQLRFNSDLNRTYLVQYSDSLMSWKTSFVPVAGTGGLVEWIDDGPPKTDHHPAVVSQRSYRVIFAP